MQRAQGGMSFSGFKTMFISDPDRASVDAEELYQMRHEGMDDELVRNIVSRRITFLDRLGEMFSTHPNIVKRLRTLNY
jgi:Zn-dependent protease with chaperone function